MFMSKAYIYHLKNIEKTIKKGKRFHDNFQGNYFKLTFPTVIFPQSYK